MNTRILLVLLLLQIWSSTNKAQSPTQPFTYGDLPAGWSAHDVTQENNGLFKIGFARVLKGESGFGFIYEGAMITVEQLKPQTLEQWKEEMYGHMPGTPDSDGWQTCTCTRLANNETKVGGYPAFSIGERQNCFLHDGKFDDVEDIITYYIKVGDVAYMIYSESDSETEGGNAGYNSEIAYIISTFRFFGGGGNNTTTITDDNNTGNDDNIVVDPGTTTTTGGGDDDWSVGDIVIGTVVGGGVAGGIGLGIKAIANAIKNKPQTPVNTNKGGGNKPANNNNNGGNQPPPLPNKNTQKPPRKNDDEPEPDDKDDDEEEKEEEEEQARYVLQITKNKFELSVGGSDSVQIAVWRITKKGEKSIAQDAPIQLRSHSGALQVAPSRGNGSVQAQLSLASQPDADTVFIDVLAEAGGSAMRSRLEVKIKKSSETYDFITTQMPPDKKELVADAQDTLYFYVQVQNTANPKDEEVPKLTAKIKLAGTGVDGGWLDLGEQKFIDGWQAIGFRASNPQPHLDIGQVIRPPKQVSIEASVALPNGNVLRKIYDFPLQQPAVLDVDNDKVYFPAVFVKPSSNAVDISADTPPPLPRATKSIDITAFIEEPVAGEQWTFTAEYEKGYRKLTDIEIIPKNDSQATIRFKSSSNTTLPEGKSSDYARLIIRAKSNKRAAFNERQVHVTLRGEGIFIESGLTKGILQIPGDPDLPIHKASFVVYLWDEERKEMTEDRTAAEDIRFDFDTPNASDKKAVNVLSVAKIDPRFEFSKGDGSAQFLFPIDNEIPGNGELFPFKVRIYTHSKLNNTDYELVADAGIFGEGIGPSSEEWQKEYDNCLRYINRHVPQSHRPDMLKMLEERKMTFGHEGLYHLRHKIHSITVNLILAEGAEGYREAEKWYTDVIEMLEWCEWAGNLAFNAVAASVFGPYAPAVTIAKSYGIQALQYVLEGKTLEQWVYDTFTLHTLFKAAEGRLIDTDRIAEYFKADGTVKAYAKAWAIFIGYHFGYNVFWEKKSVVEALKQVAREIRDEAIITFFQRRLGAEANKGKDGMEPITDPIRKLRQGFVARANGQHDCKLDDVLACMRDPQAMRSLKKASPELQDAFNRTREAMYKQHDDSVKAKVAEQTGIPAEDLRIDDFRTPGGAGSNINTDRDYRLLYRAGKDANGNDIWFEVPKERWQDISYNTFGQLTGKPPHISDLEWAQKHLQLATDKAHIEASPDYSDHAIDPHTGQKTIIRPNIIAVEEGCSRLFDSTALGNMYHEKVHASLRMGQLSEAIAQCKKGVDTLNKVRTGYEMQNLDTGRLPDSIKKGMEIVKKAPTDQTATPEVMAKFNQELKEAGFHSLEDFSNKLASQFESLKKYDQQPTAHNVHK